MDIEKRFQRIENLIDQIIKKMNDDKFYTNSDINGVRKNVNDLDTKVSPEWIPKGYDYFAGERVEYKGLLYRCIQGHISQEDWAPDVAVSLWAEVPDPAEEWPEWKQPTGAHDTYSKGDKVSHNEKHWISEIDNNAYEPGVYGWAEA